MSDTPTSGKPKKHSAFAQVLFRKIGETLDLGGKAIIGFAGVGAALSAHRLADVVWGRLIGGLLFGGVFLGLGIYLQAKAEET